MQVKTLQFYFKPIRLAAIKSYTNIKCVGNAEWDLKLKSILAIFGIGDGACHIIQSHHFSVYVLVKKLQYVYNETWKEWSLNHLRRCCVALSWAELLSRVWFCDPINCSTPGLPVHHQLHTHTKTHKFVIKCLTNPKKENNPHFSSRKAYWKRKYTIN